MAAKAAPAVGCLTTPVPVVRAARLAQKLAPGSEESAGAMRICRAPGEPWMRLLRASEAVSMRLRLVPGVLATRHNLAPVAQPTLARR
jgi:hypothetical protein